MRRHSPHTDGTAAHPRGGFGLRHIAVLTVLMVTVPVLALVAHGALTLHRAIASDTADRARTVAERAAWLTGQQLAETRVLLHTLAVLPAVRGGADCGAVLAQVVRERPALANLGVIGADGGVRCSAAPWRAGLNLGWRDYVRRALASGSAEAGNAQLGVITARRTLNIAHPLHGPEGRVVGVVFAALRVERLLDTRTRALLPDGTRVALFDSSDQRLTGDPGTPGPAAVRAGRAPGARGDGAALAWVGVALDGAGLGHAPSMVVGVPERALAAQTRRALLTAVATITTALLALAFLAWSVAQRAAVRPLARLRAVAAGVARGDLAVRAGDVGGARELRDLGRWFDANLARLAAVLRAQRVLSASNRTLLRVHDETALLAQVCRIAVDNGGYRAAQVVYRDGDGMRLMARAGDDAGLLALLEARFAQARAAALPTPQAMFTGTTTVLADTSRTALADLAQLTARAGVRAAIGLPLRVEGAVIGALSIYAREAGVFGPQEVELLEEMAGDLAFGIATARLRERHRRADERLRTLAYQDAATGLPNPAALAQAMDAVRAAGQDHALVVLHLANHWEVLATLGPAHGDALIQAAAGRLRGHGETVLARLGQSEFAVLLNDRAARQAQAHARSLLAALDLPVLLEGVSVTLEASAGIALGVATADAPPAPRRLAQAARLAAHQALRTPDRVRVAGADLDREGAARLHLAADLRAALDTPAFGVYVQPQVDTRTAALHGVEALARWHHPRLGVVPPARFIALAEHTGLIRPLTWRVIELALELARGWAADGLHVPVAVNLSAHSLNDPEIIPRLRDALARSGVDAGLLRLELTESAVMEDPSGAVATLRAVRELGVGLHLDDFGTGHSTLALLRDLPLTGIKLDRSFVTDLERKSTAVLVAAVADIALAQGLDRVAEGAEIQAELRRLAVLGWDVVQGYAIARPMPGADFAPWLATWQGEARRAGGAP